MRRRRQMNLRMCFALALVVSNRLTYYSNVVHHRKLHDVWSLLHVLIIIYRPSPILEMDGIFNLELEKNKMVALDVTLTSDELDMARMEDGTTVAGAFWGKLDIVHDGDTHKMEFSGTRLQDQSYNPELLVDQRVISKLNMAAKPATAKCFLSIYAPQQEYCEVNVSFSPAWKTGVTWPPAENQTDDKFKYFLRVHPGGALEHFETESVVTAIYYEAMYAFLPVSTAQLTNSRSIGPIP